MPEQILPAPKGSLTAKMLLQLGVVAQRNLTPTPQEQQQKVLRDSTASSYPDCMTFALMD